MMAFKRFKVAAVLAVGAMAVSGCGFSPYELPLPGGADLGDNPYTVKAKFRDVLDLVPQSSVRVGDIAVGKITQIDLESWHAVVTMELNNNVELPDNTIAIIGQTSLLGEKYIGLEEPKEPPVGELTEGDVIPLENTGRNPEIEEVLGATSLLINGGGIDKVNTIVTELNDALVGNEPEVKSLLRQTNDFVGQLDSNKQELLTALEQVNRLAVETKKQEGNITEALDELPEALQVVNNQRDQLVTLLESLDDLGDVATRVIKKSKANAIKDLQLLEPILRKFADAGDDFPETISTLLTFPFTDGVVGGSADVAKNFYMGEYENLSVRLELSAETLAQFLKVPGGPSLALPELPGAPDAGTSADQPAAGSQQLVELVTGLIPSLTKGLQTPGATQAPKQQEPQGVTPAPEPTNGLGLPKICTLLGSCRVAPAEAALDSDMGKMLVAAVVTK